MSIRKVWLFVLVIVAIISIAINAFVLTLLTDRYFKGYLADSYDQHINQIIEYSLKAIKSDTISYNQMALELETHLDDPIIRIKLYNANSVLLADVLETENMGNYNMRFRGMMGNMIDNSAEEVEQFKIMDGDTVLGYLNITKNGSTENTVVAQLFKSSLIMNSLFSIGIALIFTVILGVFVSGKLSRSLRDTADYANDLQMGETRNYKRSGILEVKQIRDSLFELGTRLKLKQKSRKKLLDQMIHQTRTPLTIMKTHLEGVEDGVIEANLETIGILQNQIDTLTSIISNMSGMIDAESELNDLNIGKFDLNMMIEQIIQGLLASFQKKHINIKIDGQVNVLTETDQFRLSQAIYNILTNAYKYTAENGEVIVNLRYEASTDTMLIEVVDNGIGFNMDTKERIFDAYYRGTNGGYTSGDGLGLYVARENMQLIGGEINCDSIINKGSKFSLSFPNNYKATNI